MDYLGRAHVEFTHSLKPLALQKHDGSATDLASICREATPPCQLNPFLFNGHAQTMWTALVEGGGPALHYRRRLFESHDAHFPGDYAVDFVVDEPAAHADATLPARTTYFSDEEFKNLGSADTRPMVLALHGLTGGSHEIYLKHVLQPLVQPEDGARRWEACALISRGCAKHRVTSDFIFNARSTWDLRQFVPWLKRTFPNRPLYAVGFSLGGNLLVNVSPPPASVREVPLTDAPYSISARKARNVSSRPAWSSPTHGICRRPMWSCSRISSDASSIPRSWVST